jgi:hypothetical protein
MSSIKKRPSTRELDRTERDLVEQLWLLKEELKRQHTKAHEPEPAATTDVETNFADGPQTEEEARQFLFERERNRRVWRARELGRSEADIEWIVAYHAANPRIRRRDILRQLGKAPKDRRVRRKHRDSYDWFRRRLQSEFRVRLSCSSLKRWFASGSPRISPKSQQKLQRLLLNAAMKGIDTAELLRRNRAGTNSSQAVTSTDRKPN